MEKDSLVVKHNSLIRSRYDYTLAELRLVITIASLIKPGDEDFREYVVPAKEYAELMNADDHNIRKAVKKLGEMLLSKPLHIPTQSGFAICNWFSWYEYKEGMIHCSFHPKLKPYLLQLQEMFTKYNLENILRFKSAYSIRLYEIAKSW
jgi:plasmid replication initiation protein